MVLSNDSSIDNLPVFHFKRQENFSLHKKWTHESQSSTVLSNPSCCILSCLNTNIPLPLKDKKSVQGKLTHARMQPCTSEWVKVVFALVYRAKTCALMLGKLPNDW